MVLFLWKRLNDFSVLITLLKKELKLAHSHENPNGFSVHLFQFSSVRVKNSWGGKEFVF